MASKSCTIPKTKTRKVNGKNTTYRATVKNPKGKTEAQAKKDAEKIRKSGHLAIVVPACGKFIAMKGRKRKSFTIKATGQKVAAKKRRKRR